MAPPVFIERTDKTTRRRLSASLTVAVLLIGLASGCRKLTEIVLVVDTDMVVPREVDALTIDVTGPEMAVPTMRFDLTSSSTPAFPLTLGLTPGGAFSPVTVRVTAFRSNTPILEESVVTEFVEGHSSMLRVVLSASCLGVPCDADSTCSAGTCKPIDRRTENLPPWPGSPPALPDPVATKIGGQTLWSGGNHVCASSNNTLFCWGANSNGQLGNGDTKYHATRRPVLGLPPRLKSVALGLQHSCACDDSGKAWCWGRNDDGQLGVDDKLSAHPTAVQVKGITDCVQIAAGDAHTCASLASNQVYCWGRNDEGQVGGQGGPVSAEEGQAGAENDPPNDAPSGTSTSLAKVTSPRLVPGVKNVIQLRLGEKFSCARTTDDAVYCWGYNNVGQLGDGTAISRSTPVRIRALSGPLAELATGSRCGCARYATGAVPNDQEPHGVWCWGEDTARMVGTLHSQTVVPEESAINDAVQVAAAHSHTCVRRPGGKITCRGEGGSGQLGQGPNNVATGSVEVWGITDAIDVATGMAHSCARTARGVFCWGENVFGQLGDDHQSDWSVEPVSVVGLCNRARCTP